MDRLLYAAVAVLYLVSFGALAFSWLRSRHLQQKLREAEDRLASIHDACRQPIPELVVARVMDRLLAIEKLFVLEQIAKPPDGEQLLDTMVESVLRVFCSLGYIEYDASTGMGLVTAEGAAHIRELLTEQRKLVRGFEYAGK